MWCRYHRKNRNKSCALALLYTFPGTNAYKYQPLAEASDEDLASIVETNVLGVMLCCREAIRIMKVSRPAGRQA